MKSSCFLAFAVLDSIDAESVNSTFAQRSLLSPRNSLSSADVPNLEGVYCGWAPHKGKNKARAEFSGGKMRLQWKKAEGDLKKHPPCSTHTPHEHENCLQALGRDMDCKDEGYTVVTRPWEKDDPDQGYDVQWTNTGDKSDCITKEMGVAKDNSFNHVPLRIKIHHWYQDMYYFELFEGKTQDGKLPDGLKVDMRKEGSQDAADVDGPRDCSQGVWDGPHESPCRRRAGCKSRLLPVPSPDEEGPDEEFDDDGPDEEFDIEEFDLEDIEVV
jgi:hypothetical protein